MPVGVERTLVGELDGRTEWGPSLRGVNVVVHAAARVHMMDERSPDPAGEYWRINVDGTARLACQAAAAGVRRFVFLSSIKVNGDQTESGQAFKPEDAPAPTDAYGWSKFEAEKVLFALGRETGMEIVVIRPVLVYGPRVKANFESILRWMDMGIPLPLGAINNRRSLVAVNNLVDLITTCVAHPRAVNQVFLVSDGDDISTTELLRRVAAALGRKTRLLPVPGSWLCAVSQFAGRGELGHRLCHSLVVDITKTRTLLDWSPPVGMREALRLTAEDFIRRSRQSI